MFYDIRFASWIWCDFSNIHPQVGWFKFLTAEEGEFYNVPVPAEGEDITANLKKLRVSTKNIQKLDKFQIFTMFMWRLIPVLIQGLICA